MGVVALPSLAVGLALYFVFQLLNCFQIPPRIVLLGIFLTWPLGAALYLVLPERVRRIERVLVLLTISIVLAYLLPVLSGAKEGAGTHGPGPAIAMAATFLPFFLASGMTELALYRDGQRRFRTANGIYGLQVVATGLGLPLGWALVQGGALTPLLPLAATLCLVARLAIHPARPAWVAGALALGLVLSRAASPADGAWLDRAFAGRAGAAELRGHGFEPILETWGRYGRVTLWADPEGSVLVGAYNELPQWSWSRRLREDSIERLPFDLVRPRGSALIVGAGGGKQIAQGLDAGLDRLIGVEIEPAIVDYLTTENPDANGRLFLDSRVEVIVADGRQAIEASSEELDFIYYADLGSSRFNVLNILGDSTFLVTRESLEAAAGRLAPEGFLALFRPGEVDREYRELPHLEATFRAAGLRPWTLTDDTGYLILGAPGERGATLGTELTAWFDARRPDLAIADEPAPADVWLHVATDLHPHSSVLRFARLETAAAAYAAVGVGCLVLIGLALVAVDGVDQLRGTMRSMRWPRIAVPGLLVGLNFTLMELYWVELLSARYRETFFCSILGGYGFVITAAAGSYLHRGLRPAVRALAIATALGAAVLVAIDPLPDLPGLRPAALLWIALSTGSFFPALVRPETSLLATLFLADALGALVGSVIGTAVPVFWGLRGLGPIAMGAFVVCAVALALAMRGAEEDGQPVERTVGADGVVPEA